MKIDKSKWQPYKLLDVFTKKEENDRENAQTRFDRFLKVEHMDAESLHIKRWSSQKEGEEINPTFYKIFRKGQILFPTRNPHLRRTVLASFDGICGEKTLTLEPKSELVLPEFIPFLFHSENFYAHTTGAIIGSTNPHCRWRDVANYEFLLPPKAEQARLAELLWAIDEVIEKEKAQKDNLKKYYESISGRIFSKRVKEFSASLPFDVNSQLFKNYILDDLCELITDGAHASPKTVSNGLPIGTVENMLTDSIDISECRLIGKGDFENLVRNNCQPLIGDVLFSKDGTIGKTFVFNQKEKIILLSSIAIIRTKVEILDPYFCSLFLKSPVFLTQIEKMKSGTALKRIVLKDIKRFEILLPNLEFQREICHFIQILQKNINLIESQISSSQSLQKSIINQIF